MSDKKLTTDDLAEPSSSSEQNLIPLAEQYLDFWQQNLFQWASDPKALETWVQKLSERKDFT